MFDAPSKGTTFVAPKEPIDIDQRYIFKLTKLEDQGVSKFADPAAGQTFHNIQWTFNVAKHDTKEVIFNVDNEPWEHVEYTTSKTGKNPKNGMVAKARLWIEALLGHAVEDDEITADLPGMLLNRYGSGFFEEKEVEAQDGSTYTKLKILKLGPYRAGAKEEAKPKPEPKREPVAAASVADQDLPF
jgi:hypothetical protein